MAVIPLRGSMISLLASGISLLATLTNRNRNNMGMWTQLLQTFSPRPNRRWGMPVLLALGIGFIYIMTRNPNNMGLQRMMKPLANLRNNLGMWQMGQPFTNFMNKRGNQGDENQPFQYDGQAMNDGKLITQQ